MDRLICASLSHNHDWYEVGMLKVPAMNAIGTQLRDPINSGQLGADPMAYGGFKRINGRRGGTREESRK